ncbi:hypothetical protein I549_3945 [Mycobacterium avium subsp. avium 2285 (R)]|nr:hypothetical protein I549_3945 [Mycobacterium avium subsp. avium 2285 (R)]
MLIGVVAGLRSLTAPAVVAWAALIGWIDLHGTWASWMANIITVIVFTVLAVGELVNDKLPKTPARTAAPIFAARIVLGGLAGAALGPGRIGPSPRSGPVSSARCSAPWAATTPVGGWSPRPAARTCRSRCSKTWWRSRAGSPFSRRPGTC